LKKIPSNIIISRTDSIGDVVLTLPVAAVLKKNFPEMKIAFMGRPYTKPVIEACEYVDEFIDATDFLNNKITVAGESPQAIIHVFPAAAIATRAKHLRIPLRIGTTNRLYHWFTCNELVKLSRKNSSLHEAQLNLALLKPFGINENFSLQKISELIGMNKIETLNENFASLISVEKYNLIIHPKSQGSGREWPLENFIELIKMLDIKRFNIFISGTEKEYAALKPLFAQVGDRVTNIAGKMSLAQFISFIKKCDGLLANSTGPLHIAAALGRDAFGIYVPLRPIHPGRWAPVGPKTKIFVRDEICEKCKGPDNSCACILQINALAVKAALDKASEGIQIL
jgi:ADP-heptose:LPS heptosyltransferase